MSLRCDNCGTTSIGDFEECPHCGQETSLKDVREQLAEAQAQAAAWEEIALALASPNCNVYVHQMLPWPRKFFLNTSPTKLYDSPRAALLAWHAAQKGKPNA